MKRFTIGFTKKTARQFFETLKVAGVKKLNDVGITSTDRVFLTLSLAEPFRDQAGGCDMCYKLVAAVLVLPK
jgi:hypothetical protein